MTVNTGWNTRVVKTQRDGEIGNVEGLVDANSLGR